MIAGRPANFVSARASRRRGVIFITAMWMLVILVAMVLIFARSMRVELAASTNRVCTQQAATLELGAEQYVLSAVDACEGDAVTVLQTPAEQLQLGDGYFWIMQSDPNNDYDYAFGITDENSKLNINYSTDTALATLPGITQDVADSIIKWTGSGAKTQGQGADASVYGALPRPYTLKAAKFETVEELYLLPNVTDTLLYGYDHDHNGMIDTTESGAQGDLATAFNAASDTGRGIAPFITVWGIEPNTDANGKPRVNLLLASRNPALLRNALRPLPTARITQIMRFANRPAANIFDFALNTGMKSSELAQVADHFTTSTAKTLPGLVNVNTASQQVLMCLPNITQEDATNIVAHRPGNTATGSGSSSGTGTATGLGQASGSSTASPTSYAWLLDVGLTRAKLSGLANLITGRSYFYSADIVAVSGNGGAFKRVRIVVDARSSPPVIVYRKDLTHLGWPLSPDILTALKTHQPLPPMSGMGTGGANGLSVLGQ